LQSEEDDSEVNKLLIPQIRNMLKKRGISYSEVKDDEQLEALSKVLSPDLVNNIIPGSMSLYEANRLVTRLGAYQNANPDKNITLFGYPDWQAMNKSYLNRLYELDTYIFSSFYADMQQKNVREFQILFNETFGRDLLNTFPKYGMMGYDIASYFIPRMVFEKSESMQSIPSLTPIQNNFRFKSTNALKGSFNQIFYIIHYTRDNKTEVIPMQ
jgi:hypothetical protein